MGGLVALGLTGLGLGAAGQAVGAWQQSKAADKALKAAQERAQQQSKSNAIAGSIARDELNMGGQAASQALMEGMAGAGANIYDYGNLARQDFTDAMGQSRQDLLGGMGAAQDAYSPLTQMLGYANQAGGALGGMLGKDPFANFEADPGYQFRQQQGEQAINRAAAASGGRVSGRTMQDLAKFNSGLASQEFGNFAQRQLANQQNQMGMANQLAGLGGIGANAQGNLANMMFQGGQGLANQSQNYGQGMSNMAMNMGTNLGNTAMQGGQGLANMLWGQQQAAANTHMSQMGAENALAQGLIGQSQAATPYAGGAMNAIGNSMSNLGAMGLMAGLSGSGGGGSPATVAGGAGIAPGAGAVNTASAAMPNSIW